MKKVEMVGKKFGKLTVLKQAPNLYKKNRVVDFLLCTWTWTKNDRIEYVWRKLPHP